MAITLAFLGLVALSAGAHLLPVVAIMAIVTIFYHVRCEGRQRHDQEIAKLKIQDSVAQAETIKARYRALLSVEQPKLPLTQARRELINRESREGSGQ